MNLPKCTARRELNSDRGDFVCLHPNVEALAQRVTASICRACQFAGTTPSRLREFPTVELGMTLATLGAVVKRDGLCFHLGEFLREEECATCSGRVRIKHYQCNSPAHAETTVAQCGQCPDYEPRLRRSAVRNWAVGVVTAPREEPTLATTLQSLRDAGWPVPRLFVEPETELPSEAVDLPVSLRSERLGLWPNWLLGLTELVLRHPDADAYLMVEDDVLFRRGLRRWLEERLWPLERIGVVSLFCPKTYASDVHGWKEVKEGWGFAGAQALIFPPPSARLLLGDPLVLHHRRRGPRQGNYDTDAVVGLWAELSKLPVLVHSPSLVQHVGNASTSGHGRADGPYRSAVDFDSNVLPE